MNYFIFHFARGLRRIFCSFKCVGITVRENQNIARYQKKGYADMNAEMSMGQVL